VDIFTVNLLYNQHKNAIEKLHYRQTLNGMLHIIHFLQHLQIVYNTTEPFYIRYAANLYFCLLIIAAFNDFVATQNQIHR